MYRPISTDRCQNKSNHLLVIAEPCWDVYRSRDRMKTFWGYIACILEITFVATFDHVLNHYAYVPMPVPVGDGVTCYSSSLRESRAGSPEVMLKLATSASSVL